MKISNKFNIGDTVYYPSADLRAARIFKSVVTGIVITNIDDKQVVIYQTGHSYGVSEEDMFKIAKPAKRRLVKIMQDKKKQIAKDIDEAIKKVNDTKTEELVYDLTAKDETKDEEQEVPIESE